MAVRLDEALIRVRISQSDSHYGGGVVDGGRLMQLLGDVATELLIRHDGDEGLFRAYDNVEFLVPVYAGDFLEARGRITAVGNTSRRMEFTIHKVIASIAQDSSSAEVLPEPVLVLRASGTCVVPKDRQRRRGEHGHSG
ncbi:MAG: 3-aminobutyryl-CoA ammonia lyase [Firmicutes bacterium]|nr:3-aminobutyryl-CoA ammonia lyase [Bacillota bacterium]MDH7496461.1 hotdog domain-containing protein [Bacillota bacterium]